MSKIAVSILTLLVVFVVFRAEGATSRYLLHKRLAIIIDDMGYDKKLAMKFASLDLPITFSFLPDAPFSRELSDYMGKRGYAIMIHMPSEPLDYPKDNPGRYAIYTTTSKKRTFYLLERAYKKIRWAIGLNNHMGSRILKDRRHLDYIMEFLRQKHMFFVDSATVKHSLGCVEARRFNVLCIKRRVFLDNKKSIPYIEHQIELAIKMLGKRDDVVAIGHCNIETYRALRRMERRLKPYLIGVEYLVK